MQEDLFENFNFEEKIVDPRPTYESIIHDIFTLIIEETQKDPYLKSDDLFVLEHDLKREIQYLDFPMTSYQLYSFYKNILGYEEETCYSSKDFFDGLSRKIELLLKTKISEWAASKFAPDPKCKEGDLVDFKLFGEKTQGHISFVKKEDCTYWITPIGRKGCSYIKNFEDIHKGLKNET